MCVCVCVLLAGLTSGVDRSGHIPVAGVVIQLRSDTGDTIGFAMSNSNGEYKFAGVERSMITRYTAIVLKDGILRPNSGFNRDYDGDDSSTLLQPRFPSIDRRHHYGAHRSLRHGFDNNLLLVLNTEADLFARGRAAGNGHTVNYWSYQWSVYRRGCSASNDELDVDMHALAEILNFRLKRCESHRFRERRHEGHAPYKFERFPELSTVILNRAIGRGVYSPYEYIEKLLVQWAVHVECGERAYDVTESRLVRAALSKLITK